MNAKQLFAALTVFTAAGSAFAAGATEWANFDDFVSTKTRAEVIAELKQAQAEGQYALGGESFVGQLAAQKPAATAHQPAYASTTPATGKTRAEVIAELKQAQADGSYVVGGNEFVDFGSAVASRSGAAMNVAKNK